MALGHEKVGATGQGLWHHKGWQLPAYIQHVANDLIASGHSESRAIEMAVGIIKNWAHGHDGHGNRVTAETAAKAAAALAEWEALKAAASKGKRSVGMADTPSKPYGDVSYADPGYLDADGNQVSKSGKTPKKRYPLTADKVMAAWSYINQAKNAAQYTQEQLAAIKGRIKAAMKKFGHDVTDDQTRAEPEPRPSEFLRAVAVDDIRIRKGGTGRTVEAYAAVFDDPAEIVDQDGHYIEVNSTQAFDRTIGQRQGRFPVVYHHGLTIAGTPSDRGSVPIGVSIEVRADKRGVLTVSEYGRSQLADEVLEAIQNGSIAGQSYGGSFLRSDPRRPRGGYRRGVDGQLSTVRRLEVAMREFGPTPFPAFSGAAILGVRAGMIADLATYGISSDRHGDATTPHGDPASSEGTPPGPAPQPDDPPTHSSRSKADTLLADIRRARIIREME
jgi:phage head maturation protease